MSAIPDTSLGRRSIGEILLEHGYVTQEQVDSATAMQLESDRPLGQILVEAGTITRLELASALAEQWSDSGAPIAPPLGLSLSGTVPTLEPSEPSAPRGPSPAQTQFVSRLEQIEEALEKLTSSSEEEDDSVAFRAAVEEMSDRLANAEPAIEELGRRLEALALDNSRDGRLDELDGLVRELHGRLGSLDQSVDVATSRSGEVAADAAHALQGMREELTSLSSTISGLAEGEEVEKLRELVDALSQRPIRDPDLASQLEDLSAVVEALNERPIRDRELAAQVDELARTIGELGDRIDVISVAAQSAMGDHSALEELQRALAELSQRPAADPATDRRLDDLTATLDELRSSMQALAAQPAGDPMLDEKLFEVTSRLEDLERADMLEELRARIVELAERPTVDPTLAQRLTALESRIEALPIDDVLEEVGAGDRSLGYRIDGVVARVDEVAVAIEEVGGSQVSREAWDEAIEVLNSRIDAEREMSARLAELEERLSTISTNGASSAPDTQLAEQLTDLTARMDELAAFVTSAPPMGDGSEAATPSGATPATLERDVEHVLMAIERLSVHLGAHERALTELMGANGVVPQLRELGARVGDLETYGTGGSGDGTGGGGGDGEMRAELRALMRRLEEAESAQKNDRERVIEQLEKAAGAIDWRLQRLEAVRSDEPAT